MCTVSFIARKRGYLLGMNRDERLSRVPGRPPQRRGLDGRTVLGPSEPGGGTWIAANDSGATLALINWYAIARRVQSKAVSRGEVVNAVGAAGLAEAAAAALARLPCHRINPFRLIGIFPETGEVTEWRWDLRRLVRLDHRWESQQWISSGFDEPEAQRVRSGTFTRACGQSSFGNRAWLRRLHRSHVPQAGPFSICMHRSDAATVSYSEVAVSARSVRMWHLAGPPCESVEATSISCARRIA